MAVMWNMYVIEGLCLSSWFRLYFKDHGVSLYKELIFPLHKNFLSFFPSTSLTFTKKDYVVLSSSLLNLTGFNPYILASCLEKNSKIKIS